MNPKKILFVSFLLLSSAIICADTILLKNGGKISTSQWWYEGNELKYYGYGGVYGISAREVELIVAEDSLKVDRIKRSQNERRSQTARVIPEKEFQELESKASELETIMRNAPTEEREQLRLRIAETYTRIGNALFLRKSYESALSYYMKALDQRPDFLPAKINIATTFLASGNYRDPLPYLREALSENPDDPTLHEILGEIYYMTDNVEEALGEWERSVALEQNESLQKRIEKVRKELSILKNYQISNASHFTLIFDGEKYSHLGDDILAFLEENFDELVYKFSFYPQSPISVIMYPESDFYAVTESPKWVGGLFDGKIRIPVGGLQNLTLRAKRMINHELAHAFIYSKTKGNCPRWLHEGIAQIMEGKAIPVHSIARDELEKITFSSLNEKLDYGLSLSIVSYIEQTYSFHCILLLLEELGRGKDMRKALEKSTGMSVEDFLQDWKNSITVKGAA